LEGGGIEKGKEDSCKETAASNIHIVGQREREEGRGTETHSGFDIKKTKKGTEQERATKLAVDTHAASQKKQKKRKETRCKEREREHQPLEGGGRRKR